MDNDERDRGKGLAGETILKDLTKFRRSLKKNDQINESERR